MQWRLPRPARLCLAALAFAIGGCTPRDSPAPASIQQRAAAHEEGRRVYNFRCYYCHGYSGDARTLAASFIDPKPRDFRAATPDSLTRAAMLAAVRDGRAGTAMASFAGTLSERQIEQVVDFVREEFIIDKRTNTRYHTTENGWPRHERYVAAFPFATGAIALDTPWEDLSLEQIRGKRLYLSACVSCHDRARVKEAGEPWALRGVSFPPGNYDEDEHSAAGCADCRGRTAVKDAVPARQASDDADPYELHEQAPHIAGLSRIEKAGAKIFAGNCAHCHAADGSGRNWRGSFLDPHPPDFTRAGVAARLTRERVAAATREGVDGTSMPAWRDVLSRAQVDAVTAYVVRAWGGAATPQLARGDRR